MGLMLGAKSHEKSAAVVNHAHAKYTQSVTSSNSAAGGSGTEVGVPIVARAGGSSGGSEGEDECWPRIFLASDTSAADMKLTGDSARFGRGLLAARALTGGGGDPAEGGGGPADFVFGHEFSATTLPTPGRLSDSWAATFSVSPAAALFERKNHKAAACASVGEDAEFDEFGDDWEWIFADQAFREMRDDFERDMDAQGLQWGDGQPWWDVDRWASAWWADGRAGRDLCKTGAAAFVTWAHGMRRVAQDALWLAHV